MLRTWIVFAATLASAAVVAQRQPSDAEVAISNELAGLRSMPDPIRATTTRDVALQIRKLPPGPAKVDLALRLTDLATEGDFGRLTAQAAADSLTLAVKETPPVGSTAYLELANLAQYEDAKIDLDSSAYRAAVNEVAAIAERRKRADFTLVDRSGKTWSLSALKGKVVLVNFWSSASPAYKSETTDLNTLAAKFKDGDLVILGIAAENSDTVDPFLQAHPASFPILLDSDQKVSHLFGIDSTPQTLVYNRKGQLIGQSINRSTLSQLQKMLGKAGLK